MTRNEAAYLCAFLEELGDRYGNDGCNDFSLPDTAENRQLVLEAEKYCMGEDARDEVSVYSGKLLTSNTIILSYLKHKFQVENGVTKTDYPDLNL